MQSVFKRYELKYMITKEQKEKLLNIMEPYMALDKYGRTTIRNIYFDTDTYRLIRHSIEKPAYKEKLRIRSYRKADPESPVFIELKKKYKSIVYKRRLSMHEQDAMKWVCEGVCCQPHTQIANEIDYFLQFYKTLHPTVFLSYEREAFCSKCGDEFRVTFDENILCRQEDLALESEIWGESLLEDGKILMEIKTPGGIPLWMTHALSKEHIYKTSFSKYGMAYQKIIYPRLYKKSVDEIIERED